MSGEEIFEKYTSKPGEYAQTLFTARMIVSDDREFFNTLARAEKQGKKIAVVELPEGTPGEPSGIEFI